jgi:lysozyme family protein
MTEASSTIDAMIDDVIRREGGYVDHPADRGGPTRFGITRASLAHYRGRDVTAAEVAALSRDEAKHIYRRDYYQAPRIDQLPARIQPFVFDSAVNHGPARAIRFVQQVCNQAGFGAPASAATAAGALAVDGACGPRTVRAAHDADWAMKDWLLAALVEERRNFYHAIVARDPGQAVFLKGWLARVREFDPAIEGLVA